MLLKCIVLSLPRQVGIALKLGLRRVVEEAEPLELDANLPVRRAQNREDRGEPAAHPGVLTLDAALHDLADDDSTRTERTKILDRLLIPLVSLHQSVDLGLPTVPLQSHRLQEFTLDLDFFALFGATPQLIDRDPALDVLEHVDDVDQDVFAFLADRHGGDIGPFLTLDHQAHTLDLLEGSIPVLQLVGHDDLVVISGHELIEGVPGLLPVTD